MAFAFNGTTKRITLSAGTTAVVLADLYSRYKEWVLAGNASAPLAFTTVGGDIPAIPLYLFLENGWRIVPQSADHALAVGGGILEVQGGGDPFVDPAGSYKIRITRQAPGIAIGYSTTGVASPTASDIAAAVAQRTVEGALTTEQVLRVLLAALAGKSTGVGTDAEQYLALDGTTPRVAATFDSAGNRATVAVNGS